MNVVSIDPGVTSSGFYVFRKGRARVFRVVREDDVRHHYVYLSKLRNAVLSLAPGAQMALVEGYPFQLPGSRVAYAIEAGGVVREALATLGVPIVVMPIPVWKASFIGLHLPKKKSGSASNTEQYLREVERHFGKSFKSTDEADAFMIYAAALAIWNGEYQTAAALRVRESIALCAEQAGRTA